MRVNDKRGNNTDRANRKRWLLSQFGDGTNAQCVHCGQLLDYDTVEADRIIPGGSYKRDNIQPADRHCNASRGNRLDWVGPLIQALS